MSDTLTVSITATGAVELEKLFTSLEKVSVAAAKLADSGKALEELRRAVAKTGNSGSALGQLKTSIKQLQETVQALPTQMATALQGVGVIGQRAGESLGAGVSKGLKEGAKGLGKDAEKVVDDATKALNKKIKEEAEKARKTTELAYSSIGSQKIVFGPLSKVSSAPKLGESDVRRMLGLPERSEMKTFAAQIKAQMQQDVQLTGLRVKSASRMTVDDTRGLLGLPDRSEMKTFAARLKAQMQEDVKSELAKGSFKVKSAGVFTLEDFRALTGMPSRAETAAFSAQLKAELTAASKVAAQVQRETAKTKLPFSNITTRQAVNFEADGEAAGASFGVGMSKGLKASTARVKGELAAEVASIKQQVLAATRQAEGAFSTLSSRPARAAPVEVRDQARSQDALAKALAEEDARRGQIYAAAARQQQVTDEAYIVRTLAQYGAMHQQVVAGQAAEDARYLSVVKAAQTQAAAALAAARAEGRSFSTLTGTQVNPVRNLKMFEGQVAILDPEVLARIKSEDARNIALLAAEAEKVAAAVVSAKAGVTAAFNAARKTSTFSLLSSKELKNAAAIHELQLKEFVGSLAPSSDLLAKLKAQDDVFIAGVAAEAARTAREIARAKAMVTAASDAPTAIFSNVKTGQLTLPTPTAAPTPKIPKLPTDDFLKFNGVAGTTNTIVRGLSSSFGILQSSIGSMLPLLGGAGLGMLLVQVAKQGAEVEHTFETIRVLGSTTGQGIAQLNAEMLNLARTGPFGPQEVATAMKTLSLAGLEANDILKVTKSVLNFSVAGNVGIDKAADTLVSISTAFGMGVEGFARVGDVIAKTAAVSKSSVEGISESFKTASVISKQYGVSLVDVGVGLAALSQLNITNTAAGVAMRNMYVDLSGRTKQVTAALKSMGLEFRDAEGKMLPVLDLVARLASGMNKLTGPERANQIQKIFSERGGKLSIEFLDLFERLVKDKTGKVVNELARLRKDIEESFAFSALAALQMSQTTESRFKGIAASFQASLVEAFAGAQPALQDLYLSLREVLNNPEFTKGISELVSFFARLAQAVVELRGVFTVLLAVWAASRVSALALGAAKSYLTAQVAASTLALATNTAATTANATATAAGATAATGAVGAIGTVMKALSALNIVLGLAAIAWSVYEFWQAKSQNTAAKKANQSVDLTIEQMREEIVRTNARADALRAGKQLQDIQRVQDGEIALEKVRKDASVARIVAEEDYQAVVARGKQSTGIRGGGLAAQAADEAKALKVLDEARKVEAEKVKLSKFVIDQLVESYRDENAALEESAAARARKNGTGVAPVTGKPAKEHFDRTLKDQGEFNKRSLKLMTDAYEAESAVTQRAYSDQQQLLDASLSAGLTSEAQHYVDSLTQTIEYEEKRRQIIESYRNSATSEINGQQADLEVRVPGVKKLAANPEDWEGLSAKVRQVVTEYARLTDELTKIQTATKKSLEVLDLESGKRKALASISLQGSLQKDTKAYTDLSRSVDVAIKKEKERLAVANGSGGKRADIEANARIEAEAAFQERLEKREEILEGLKTQQDLLNDAWDEFVNSGNETGADEIAGQFALVNAQVQESTSSLAELKAKMAELGDTAAQRAGQEMWKEFDSRLDGLIDKTQKLGEAFEDGFGRGAKALVNVGKVLNDYGSKQKQVDEIRKKGADAAGDDIDKWAKVQQQTDDAREKNTIEMYVSLASAAKGFFKEGTRGYQALQAVETTYRAATIAGNLIEGVSAAAVGVATQAKGEPYTAVPRMAAMAAIMAGLGFATGFFGTSSSGNAASAATRQGGAATGRVISKDDLGLGTVFGDTSAKSESIKNSLEALKDIDTTMLQYSGKMVRSLSAIEGSMAGLANLIVRNLGLTTDKNMGVATGTLSKNKGDPIVKSLFGSNDSNLTATWGPLGKLADKLHSLWGGVKQDVIDTGLTVAGTIAELSSGAGVKRYADVATTTSSWFGLSKDTVNSTQFKEVSDQFAEQFGRIFTSIGDTLKSAATALGRDGNQVLENVNNFVVGIERLSLKDLKGEELQAAIEAAIGSAADSAAEAAVPGFDAFQKIGEGYFETIIRVASGVEYGTSVLEKFHIAAVDYNTIVNKQGDVAAELVRGSIKAVETSGGVLSGVGQIIDNVSGSASELADVYGALNRVRTTMRDVGLDASTLNVGLLRAAGGIDELQASLDTFYDKYFTGTEKITAQTNNLTEQFSQLGYVLPSSRDQLKQWILALDENDPAMQATLAGLLKLTPAFDDLQTALDEVASSLVEALAGLTAKFQTALQKMNSDYAAIAGNLQGAGLFTDRSQDDLTAQLKALPRDQILGIVQTLIDTGQVSGEAAVTLTNLASSLVDVKDAAAGLNQQLQDAIDSNISKVLTPQQNVDYQYYTIGRDLQGAGLFSDMGLDSLLEKLKALPKDQILGVVQELINTGQVSGEAAITLVNLASSLADVKDAANAIDISVIQEQMNAITEQFGDLSVLDESKNLSEQFVENRNHLKELEDGLASMLGTVDKSVQEVLGDMLASQKALKDFRVSLGDAIDSARLKGLKGQAKVDFLKTKETSLYGQLQTTEDPVAVAQKLQSTIIERIQAEAELRQAGATELSEVEKTARDAQLDGLRKQIDGAKRLADLAKSISQFTSELRFSDLSPKSYESQLGEAKALFDSTLAKAKGGDETAQGQLTSNAKSYLDEARAYYASGSAYAQIFNSVTGSLDSFGSTLPTDPIVSQLEKELAKLEEVSAAADATTDAVIDTSAEEVEALMYLDSQLALREATNQEKIDRQLKLAQDQIDELKLLVEGQKTELTQQKAIYDGLVAELKILNGDNKRRDSVERFEQGAPTR